MMNNHSKQDHVGNHFSHTGLPDLIKISFKDSNYLICNGKSLCVVPHVCLEQILSSIRLRKVKNLEKQQLQKNVDVSQISEKEKDRLQLEQAKINPEINEKNEEEEQEEQDILTTPIKVGQLFYIQFYFTGLGIYYDANNNKLVLSLEKRTAFKIIQHIGKIDNHARDRQVYDIYGQIVPNEQRYLIVMANQLLFLKHSDQNLYLGNYDDKAILGFANSLFKSNLEISKRNIIGTPCRLFSVEQEKYVVFSIEQDEILLKPHKASLQGICIFQKNHSQIEDLQSPTLPFHRKKSKTYEYRSLLDQDKVVLRVLQGDNNYFVMHKKNIGRKLIKDIDIMLKPLQTSLNSGKSFFTRYEPTFSLHKVEQTFNLSNISSINMVNNIDLQKEIEEITQQLIVREINFRNLEFTDWQELSFILELYPSMDGENQIFIYNHITGEKEGGKKTGQIKRLYFDHRQIVKNGKQQCILKQFNSLRVRRQNSKLKNILRVQYIKRQMLEPYIFYYCLKLNLKICRHYSHLEQYKLRIYILQIQNALSCHEKSLLKFGDSKKERYLDFTNQLLQLGFIQILEELLEVYIKYLKLERQENNLKDIDQDYVLGTTMMAKIISIIKSFILISPEKLISFLLKSRNPSLFIILCRVPIIYHIFLQITYLCEGDPRTLIQRLQKLIQTLSQNKNSKCINICYLWAFRLVRQYRLNKPKIIQQVEKLISDPKINFSQDSLVKFQLAKISKQSSFFLNNIIKYFPLQRIQQQYTSLQLCNSFLDIITEAYKSQVSFPFKTRYLLQKQMKINLQKDNRQIIQNFIEDILSKNCKFESIENKLISFKICLLYLSFNQGIKQQVYINELNCLSYIPLLLVILEEHLQEYIYDEKYLEDYILLVLECYLGALRKQLELIILDSIQMGIDSEQIITRTCNQQLSRQFQLKQNHQKNRQTDTSKRGSKNDKKSSQQQRTSKLSKRTTKLQTPLKRRTKLINFIFRRKVSHEKGLLNFLDKELIYQIIETNHSYNNIKLDMLSYLIKISSILLQPRLKIAYQLCNPLIQPSSFSGKCKKIMSMISNKNYVNNFWTLIRELCSVHLEEEQWRAIVSIFNKNKLLKYFIIYEESNMHHQPSQEQICMLFLVMSRLVYYFLKWTKQRIGFSHLDLKKLKQNIFQVTTNRAYYLNDLQPQAIVAMLSKQKKIYYYKQQIDFHILIVKSIGIVTSRNIYEYYSNYIIRFECEKYNIDIIRFILIFIESLNPTFRINFVNDMQYSLFKQKSQLRILITTIVGNKLNQNQNRESIRAKNFNILSEIDQGTKHNFSTDQNSKRQFLVCLFRLLTVVEKDTTIHKEIISELSYEIITSILFKYNKEILVKLSVINYVVISVEKQLQYGRKKYLKSNSDNESYFDFNEQDEGSEHMALMSFIKHSNYFLQKQRQNFKNKLIRQRQHNQIAVIKYIQALLCIMRVRVSISKYLNYERNDKIQWGSKNREKNASVYEQNEDQFATASYLAEEDKSSDNKARKMVYYHTSVSINENQLQNLQGINKLLCFDLIDSLQSLLQINKLSKSLQNLLTWLEYQYKISLSNYSSLDLENTEQNILVYKLSNIIYYNNAQSNEDIKSLRTTYIQKSIEKKDISTLPKQTISDPNQKINHFFGEKIESYFVLLIQLLQRILTVKQNHLKMMKKSNKYIFSITQDPEEQVIYIIDLIKSYLIEEIQMYRIQDEKRGKKDFEELPEKYYQSFGVKVLWLQEGNRYKQKCCQIDFNIFQTIFQILLLSFRIQKPVFVYQLLNIIEKITYYNLTNQINLQKIITKHFSEFYEVFCSLIKDFREISPIVNDFNFIVRSYLNKQYRSELCIYGLEDQQVLQQNVNNLELYLNSFRGIQGIHTVTLNYFSGVKMLLAACKSLNFDFKQLFSKPTIQKQSIISQTIEIFSQIISNLQIINEEKYEYIRVTIKLINSFLRGPVEQNIEAAINKGYCKLLFQLLQILNKKELTSQSEKIYNIKVKKIIAEGIFLLIPFMQMGNDQMKVCQIELRTSFVQSKKSYTSNYENIISDYVEKANSQTGALLYFDLALNFYYCLIEIYKEKKVDKISKIQLDILNKVRKEKKKMKTFKVLYQIYFLLKNIFSPIFRVMNNTYEYIINETDEKIILNKALSFFTNNVSQIDVKVNNKIKRISFLLLKEARCNNISITKQFHRLIGKDQRQLRLIKFMKISKFIIIRLQISKQVRKVIQNFKPLQMIVLNRQLWKSMCFSNGFLLNLLYLFQNSQYVVDLQLIRDIKYVIISLLYTEIFFLFLIYFVEVLPLKFRINRIFSQTAKKGKKILFIIKDKTLAYAIFYCLTLTLSFYYPGMIAILMLDYFFRLKITSKTTFMLVRSVSKILYVVFLLFMVLYLSTSLLLSQKNRLDNCTSPAGCTQDLFYVFMELRFNVKLDYYVITLGQGILLFLRYVLKITNLSLMVSIIYMEKKKQHLKSLETSKWIHNQCFICGNERNDIQKKRNSNTAFYHHIEMQHNLWNYIYYLVYLKNKDNKNLNSIENMIIQQWEKEKIEWLPDNLLQAM